MNTFTRTLFCRIAFVLLVALPTCATLGYVVSATLNPVELTPKAWSLQLSKESGLEIHIGKMERTALGVFVLENFEIGDPESDAIWISAPRVEAMIDAKGLTLVTSNASIRAGSLRKIEEYLQHRVLRGRTSDFQPLTLRVTDSKLILSDEAGTVLPMPKLDLVTRQQKEGPELEVKAKVIEDGVEVWAALWASRIRSKGQASTKCEWGIDGGEGLSARTLAEFSPEWKKLGPLAKFCGSMVDFGDEQSKYQLSGVQIQDIDLAILGEAWGIEGLTGFGSLSGTRQGEKSGELEKGAHVEFRSGKITALFGDLRIQQGSCDGALLARVAGALHLETSDGLLKQRFISFDECAIAMEMRGESLRFRGLLENSGVIERNREQLAWFNPTQKIRNAHDVVSTILSEVHSETLPTSQWIAAMPASKGTIPAASTARKPSKTR